MTSQAPNPAPKGRRARFAAGAVLLLAAALAGVCRAAMGGAGISLLVFGRPVAIACILLFSAAGLGGLALRALRFRPGGGLQRLVLAAALGLGLHSWVLTVLGLVGLLRLSTALAIVAVGLLALAWQWRHRVQMTPLGNASSAKRRPGQLCLAAAPLLAAALAMAFLAALTPPVSYDVLEYHLPVTREWIRTGRLTPLPFNFYSQLPFGVEMLYAQGLLLEKGADATPKLINFGLLALTCLAVAALALRLGAPAGLAALAAAQFAVHPTTVRIYVDAFADMGAALFAAASALCLLWRPDQGRWRRPLIGGLLAGFAVSAKTAAAGIFLLPALAFLVAGGPPPPAESRSPAGWHGGLGELTIFLAAAAIAFCPWPLRNWIATGNPGAPFLNAWFGAEPWRLETERFWLGMHGRAAPFSLAHLAALARRLNLVGWPWAFGTLGALIAGNKPLRRVALATAAGYGVYGLLTGAPDRFAAPIIALGIVLTHAGVAQVLRPGSAPRRWAVALLLLAALPPAWFAAQNMASLGAIEYAAGAVGRDGFLRGLLGAPPAEMFQSANEKTPRDARILCLYEARSYLLERSCLANTVFDKSPLLEALRRRRPGESLALRLRAEGFTHLLVNEWEMARLIATHATETVRADLLYRQILGIPDERLRYEALATHPEWYAPYARAQAAPEELKMIGELLNAAAERPLFIQRLGSIRMFVAEIPSEG